MAERARSTREKEAPRRRVSIPDEGFPPRPGSRVLGPALWVRGVGTRALQSLQTARRQAQPSSTGAPSEAEALARAQDLASRIFCSLFSRQKVSKIASPPAYDGVQGRYIAQRGSRQ